MKSCIENIRKYVKKKGYVPTSDIIKKAIYNVCPDGENILENKAAIVDEVIRLMNVVQPLEPSQNSELCHQDASTNLENDSIPDSLTEPPTDLKHIEIENQIIEPEQEAETRIVVSEDDKHDLIVSQASELGIELSEVEVVDLATSLKDNFLDYESFIDEVVSAVVTYHDHRTDKLEQKIKNAREHIEYRRKQLNQTLVGEFGEMNNFFRQGAAKRKELSKAIAEAFKT